MLRPIALKVEQGIRINEQEALWLFEHADLAQLGQLANRINLRKNGNAVFYNINRHINPTNICSLSCKFCAYSKKIGEAGGYAYEIDEMIVKAREAVAQGATELHMVGGLHPRWNFQRYVDMISAMHKSFPDVHLKAFTAVELDWMARKARMSIKDVMIELRNAGLGSFPGGGAEIFHAEIRDQICDTKVSGEQWIDTHRTAHKLGIRSNCTMLYGHIETFEHRVDHMRRLRDLQDETNGFNVFIPLAFQPFENEMGINRYTFGSDDLRTIAVARLYLDNFKHIKSYWVMLGQDIAQLALQFGANDLDGTVLEEKISRAAGGRAGMIMTRSNLENLIRRSGRIPVERTTLYEPVRPVDAVHMTPVFHENVSDDVQDRLTDLEQGKTILPSDLWNIAVTTPFQTVIRALEHSGKKNLNGMSLIEAIVLSTSSLSIDSFRTNLKQKVSETQVGEAGEPINIVLEMHGSDQFENMDEFLRVTKEICPNSSVTVRGLKWILPSALLLGQKQSEYLHSLRLLGLNTLEECITDQVLTNSDKWLIMECAHAAEIACIPSMTLKTVDNTVNWSDWTDQVVEMRTRSASTRFIYAVSIVADSAQPIMPTEYLKAVALTRLMLPTSTHVWTQLHGMPVLSPQSSLGATAGQNPVMKLMSTVHAFGSDSLGFVPVLENTIKNITDDLSASGIFARKTNPRQFEI